MSHHVLHILTPGVTVRKERGRLVCEGGPGPPRSLPLEDLRAVIVAARGVTLTCDCLRALLAQDAVVLHCDEKFRPAGLTAGCERLVDTRAWERQVDLRNPLHARLWLLVLRAKVGNQRAVLAWLGQPTAFLDRHLRPGLPDEGACARFYWRRFFPALGHERLGREGQGAATPPNQMLNYGYAVASALVHRAVIAHGLIPRMVIHHQGRYRAHPLVYDLVEPLRPAVDQMLADFLARVEAPELPAWCRHVALGLATWRLDCRGKPLKLLDALDVYVSSVARAFSADNAKLLWAPALAVPPPR